MHANFELRSPYNIGHGLRQYVTYNMCEKILAKVFRKGFQEYFRKTTDFDFYAAILSADALDWEGIYQDGIPNLWVALLVANSTTLSFQNGSMRNILEIVMLVTLWW